MAPVSIKHALSKRVGRVAVLTSAVAAGLASPRVSLAQSTWVPTAAGTTYDWATAANWTGGVPNAADATVNLNTTLVGAQTILLNGNRTLGTLNLGSANALGYTLAVGIPTTSVLVFDVSSGNAALNVTTGSTAVNTISAGITLNDSLLVTHNGTGNLALSGVITGVAANSLTFGGTGTTVLSATNTYAGQTIVNTGVVRATGAGSLGAGTLLLNGGTLQLANDAATNFGRNTTVAGTTTITADRATSGAGTTTHTLGTLSINGSTLNVTRGSLITSNSGGITFGATTLTGNATFAPAANAILTLGAISESGGSYGFTVNGAGTLVLNGAGTFTAAPTITGGIVVMNNATALGTASTVSLLSGGTAKRVQVGGGVTTGYNFIVGNGTAVPGTTGRGLIEQTGTGVATLTGTVTVGANASAGGHFFGGGAVGSELRFNGPINGAVGWTGGFSQRGGRIIYAGGGNIVGTVQINEGVGTLAANNGLPQNALLVGNIAAGATFDLAGFTQNIASLTVGGNGGNAAAAGTINLNGGTLVLNGNLATDGASTAAHTINGGTGTGTLDLGATNRTFNIVTTNASGLTLTNLNVIGTGGITKTGTAALTLNNSTIAGPVTVSAGTLHGTGSANGGLTMNAATILSPGTATTGGTLSSNALTFGTGATTINFNLGSATDVINGGTVTAGGTTTINILPVGGVINPGTYTLINYTGTSPGLTGFALGTLGGRTAATLQDSGTAIVLNVTGNDKVVWTGATSAAWDVNTTANWQLQTGGTPTNFLTDDDVVFGDGATNTNITLAANVSPSNVTFQNTTATPYGVVANPATAAVGITGATGLTKNGDGTVRLQTTNTYTGPTVVNGGTLELDHDAANNVVLNVASAVTVNGSGTLRLTRDDAGFTFANAISGSGLVEINPRTSGVATTALGVVLSGTNTGFSGTLRLRSPNAGTWRVTNVTPAALGSASIDVQSGAQLYTAAGGLTYNNPITIAGTGYADASGNIGALRLEANTVWAGPVTIAAGGARIGAHNTTGTISGNITGGPLEVNATNYNNTSTVVLTGTNSYTTTVIGGQNTQTAGVPTMGLIIGNGGTTGTLGTGAVTINGDGANGLLRIDRSDGYTLAQTITGAGSQITRTFLDVDTLGTGLNTNGNAITLGTTAAGGQIRIGQTRAGALFVVNSSVTTGTLLAVNGGMTLNTGALVNAGSFNIGTVGAGTITVNTGATLNVTGTIRGVTAAGAAGSVLDINGGTVTANYVAFGDVTGGSGIINQAPGSTVNIAQQLRLGHFGTNTSVYNMNGGSLTMTGDSSLLTPSTAAGGGNGAVGDNNINNLATAAIVGGGIYLGIDGTGVFNHNGGTVTTNWIVLDNRGDTGPGANMPDGIDRYTMNGVGAQLRLRSQWGIIARNTTTNLTFGNGSVVVDNTGTGGSAGNTGININVPIDAVIETVASTTTTLDTNTSVTSPNNAFTLLRNVNGTGTLALTGGGTVNLSTAGVQNVTANITSSGTTANVAKLGAGTTNLTGAMNGFTGNIAVSAGRLNLPSSALGGGNVTVADSASLGGEATGIGTLTLGNSGGTTVFFDPNTLGALTVGTLAVNGTVTLDVTASPTGTGAVTVINYGTKTGSGVFQIANAASYRGTPTIDDTTGNAVTVNIPTGLGLNWTGANSGVWDINVAQNFADGSLNPETFFNNDAVTFGDGPTATAVTLTGLLAPSSVNVNAATTNYTFTSTANNLLTGSTGLTKSGAGTLTLVGANTYSGVTAVNGGTLVIAVPTSIGNAQASNTIALAGGGRLSMTAGMDLGATRSIAVGTGGGSLSFNSGTAGAVTVSGNLSGTGALSFHTQAAGGGTFNLTGNNAGYTGDISVDAQSTGLTTLAIANQAAVPGGGSITVNFPASSTTAGAANTLSLSAVTLPSNLALNFTSFVAPTTGAPSLRSAMTSTGSTVVNGQVRLSGNSIVQFSPAANSTLTLNGNIVETTAGAFSGVLFARSTGTTIINGQINLPTAGSTLSVTDGALAVVNSTNNVLSNAQAAFGTLRLGVSNALPSNVTVTVGQNDANNATLDLFGTTQSVGNLVHNAGTGGTKSISNSSATLANLTVNQTTTATFGGPFLGNFNFTKAGGGNLTLSSTASTLAGNIVVNGGTLTASSASGGTNGPLGLVNAAGRTITVNTGSTLAMTSNNVFGNGVGNNNLPAVVVNGGTLSATRYNVLGELTLAGATLTQASTDAGGYQGFQLRGNVTVSGTSPSTISTTASKANHLGTNTVFTVADVTSSAATDLVVSAPFANQSTDFTNATGGLTKAGPGKMTLTGASTYTGATLVTAGVLQVDGSLGNTAVTVSGTGALGGSGSIAGAVSILSTLAPGASPGQMTLSNTLNLAAGSTFEAEVGKEVAGGLTIPGVGYDQIAMTGTGTTVTIADGALLKVVDLPNVEIGDVYTIVDNTAGGILTGLLRDANNANVLLTEGSTVFGSLGNQYTISYANNDVTLTAQIPEPGSAVAAAMAGLGLLARRRRRKA